LSAVIDGGVSSTEITCFRTPYAPDGSVTVSVTT
jgi:hypothetical protein